MEAAGRRRRKRQQGFRKPLVLMGAEVGEGRLLPPRPAGVGEEPERLLAGQGPWRGAWGRGTEARSTGRDRGGLDGEGGTRLRSAHVRRGGGVQR